MRGQVGDGFGLGGGDGSSPFGDGLHDVEV